MKKLLFLFLFSGVAFLHAEGQFPQKEASVQVMDGVKTVKTPDHTTVQINPDGSKVIQSADGTTIEKKADGSKLIKKADGTTIEIKADGAKAVKGADGAAVDDED